MRVLKHFALSIVVGTLLVCTSVAGTIVDRVVTNVNGHVVLQSDWEEEIAFEALLNGRSPDSFTTEERNAALDRLVDQELLREQVRPASSAPSTEVQERLSEVRKIQPDASTEAGWHATLRRYGLTQDALEKRLADEIQLMRLVQDRLRPSIQIDQQAIERYYRDELVPDIKKAGGTAAPLTEMYGKIKNVLAEKKMNELLTNWLASLRSGSQIRTSDPKTEEGNR
jgi:SurA N-terminal domain